MEIRMKIRGLVLDPTSHMPIVLLEDESGTRILPIWIGSFEANAIALTIERVTTPRPMTHAYFRRSIFLVAACPPDSNRAK